LSPAKLAQYAKESAQAWIDSFHPGQAGPLKVRPDGTIVDGHDRIRNLRDRRIDVDLLPREIVANSSGQHL